MFIHVLGTAQDGGYPQIGCNEVCCNQAWKNPDLKKNIENLRGFISELLLQWGEKNFTGHKININKNKRVKWILVNK